MGVAPILEWGDGDPSKCQFAGTSVDLRLGTHFRVPRDLGVGVIDPVGREGRSGEEGDDLFPLVRCRYGHPFVLHPGRFALAYTLEYVRMPDGLMAYVVGRSSWGRLGLIIATATMVNPSFHGVITLELANVGTVPITLYPAMRIAQLVVHPADGLSLPSEEAVPSVPPSGMSGEGAEERKRPGSKYFGQLPGNKQLLFKDRDIPWVAPPQARHIIGVVGPTGSGKSYVTNLLVERGYRRYSLASPVRRLARLRGINDSEVSVLQDLGDELRQRHGEDFLAREVLRAVRRAQEPADRLVISGFKHPAELALFQRDSRFRAIGIAAELDDCLRFRAKEMGIDPNVDKGAWEHMSTEFKPAWQRDFDDPAQPACGQSVRRCMAKLPPEWLIANGTGGSLSKLREEVEALVQKMERGGLQ
ncbi:MAG: dCTP deaminase [Thermoanaerobaculia bacterium]|nr:dCTP deaminase [Thermoanaerobaculia bacterium]